MKRSAGRIILCLVLASTTQGQDSDRSHRITATVLDADGQPVAGAGAIIGPWESLLTKNALEKPIARTDAAGHLSFTTPEGSLDDRHLLLFASGKLVMRIAIITDPGPGEAVTLGPVHLFDGVTMTGRVRDREGRPLPGVRVEAQEPATNLLYPLGQPEARIQWVTSSLTNEQGIYRLPGAPPGTALLTFSRPGYYSESVFPAYVDTPISPVLERSGYVSGRILGDRSLVSQVSVLYEIRHEGGIPVELDGDRFRFPITGRGRLRIFASNALGRTIAESDILHGPTVDPVELRVAASSEALSLRVESSGNAVETFTAHAFWGWSSEDHPVNVASRRSFSVPTVGRDGQATLQVPPGTGNGIVLVQSQGFARQIVAVSASSDAGLLCSLEKEAVISGRVLDRETGEPLAGARVWAAPILPNISSTFSFPPDAPVTDAAGNYSMTGLPAGRYAVQVDHPDRAIPSYITSDAAAGEQIRAPDIRLRALGDIRGRLSGPLQDGWFVSKANLRTRFMRIGMGSLLYTARRDALPVAVGREQRDFTLQGLDIEEQPLALVLPPLGYLGGSVEALLGSFMPGDTVHDIDLSGLVIATVTGVVQVRGTPEVASNLRVVVTKPRARNMGEVVVAVSALDHAGRYGVRLSEGNHRFHLVDVLTSMEVQAEEKPFDVVSSGDFDLPLSVSMSPVTIRFEAARADGPLAADSLSLRPVATPQGASTTAAISVRRSNGYPLRAGQDEATVYLPSGTYTAVASSHAGWLRPVNGSYRGTQLGEVTFTVPADPEEHTVFVMVLQEPPSDQALK